MSATSSPAAASPSSRRMNCANARILLGLPPTHTNCNGTARVGARLQQVPTGSLAVAVLAVPGTISEEGAECRSLTITHGTLEHLRVTNSGVNKRPRLSLWQGGDYPGSGQP